MKIFLMSWILLSGSAFAQTSSPETHTGKIEFKDGWNGEAVLHDSNGNTYEIVSLNEDSETKHWDYPASIAINLGYQSGDTVRMCASYCKRGGLNYHSLCVTTPTFGKLGCEPK